jgi:HlyD family secretion protein
MSAFIPDTSSQDRPLARRSRLRRYWPWGAAALVVIVVLALGLPALKGALSSGSSVSESRLVIATVERGPFRRDLSAEGKVVAAVSPTLYAPAAGALTLRVHAGDEVTKGQVLAVVDDPELVVKLAQERSNAATAKADLAKSEVDAKVQHAAWQSALDNAAVDRQTAANDLARQQKAFEAGAVSDQQVSHASDTLRKATITYEQASSGRGLADDSLRLDVEAKRLALARQELQVKELQRELDQMQIRSPIDGRVGQIVAADRANVAKDAALISVVDLSVLEVQMQVAESFARELSPGLPGEISGAGHTWKATVGSISPEVVDGQVAARLQFVGPPPRELRQNQRLAVRVLLDQRESVLSVPRGSFVDEGGGNAAYVVRDDLAVKQPIRLGARGIDRVEILSGLQPGDRVVISGADAFHDAPSVALAR